MEMVVAGHVNGNTYYVVFLKGVKMNTIHEGLSRFKFYAPPRDIFERGSVVLCCKWFDRRQSRYLDNVGNYVAKSRAYMPYPSFHGRATLMPSW